jgi:hypothetical protein
VKFLEEGFNEFQKTCGTLIKLGVMSRLFRKVDLFSGFDFDRKYTKKTFENNWGSLNAPKVCKEQVNEFGYKEFVYAKTVNTNFP